MLTCGLTRRTLSGGWRLQSSYSHPDLNFPWFLKINSGNFGWFLLYGHNQLPVPSLSYYIWGRRLQSSYSHPDSSFPSSLKINSGNFGWFLLYGHSHSHLFHPCHTMSALTMLSSVEPITICQATSICTAASTVSYSNAVLNAFPKRELSLTSFSSLN
ncbi:uncharacterized protein LOC124719117 isoform X2 [Schistocerca piceifrons]|uniref:uncharacterized protein LOC124719117 isoform X2 n=1 Tax=Schistocerca piceifrons TaxID=274613 RepID=UPI001F5FEA4C|nr:uncharacterized protein LOC124719117 isoform X2 [Schistocerca piceifrons]